jgi:hypothetical protein
MPDATYIACPRCGEPYAMTAMQKRLFHGRTLTCQRCAKPFEVTEETPDPVPAPPARAWGAPDEAASFRAPAAQAAPAPAAAAPTSRPDASGQLPARPESEGVTAGKMALLIATVAAALGVIVYLGVAPSVHRSREAARRATCASNLVQIGLALQLYANSNGGTYPDSLDALVANGTVPPEMLICPSTAHTPAPGKTPAEQAGKAAGGPPHLSYVYLGKNVTFATARQVLVYEPLEHHGGEGINVLYSDGTTQFLARPAALTALPQLDPNATPAPAATAPVLSPP